MASRAIALFATLVLGASIASANVRVLAWPRGPDDTTTGVDAAIRAAGFEPVAFTGDPRVLAERAAAAEAKALDAIQVALARARDAYLRQDFATMAATLERAETAALPVLARSRHVPVLWELEFQRGLAELSRQDIPAARKRFALALELDDKRAPKREIYGPAVAAAFSEAADARTGIPPRPVPLRIAPRDATVLIDGLVVIDNARPRDLRPGMHVVLASAPGYDSRAILLDLAGSEPIEIELVPAAGSGIDRIADAWIAGTLDPGTESGRRAILRVATDLGATAVLIVQHDSSRGDQTARVITAADETQLERRPTTAAAASAALSRLGSDGALLAVVATPPRPARASVLRSWWLWTAVGVVAAASIGVAFSVRGDDTIRVLPPDP